MYQLVEFVNTELHPVQRFLQTQYQYRPDRPMRWLQRLLFWILKKLKCWAIVKDIKIKRYTIDPKRFIEQLLNQHRELVQTYGLLGSRLLIGPEELGRLLSEDLGINLRGSFDAEYMHNGTVMNMTVTIIPWMKGILVLPKDI